MKPFYWGTLLLLALLSAPNLFAGPPSDRDATAKLVGVWTVPPKEYTNVAGPGEITFKPDGTFSSTGFFKVGDVEMQLDVEGKWKVKHGVLVEEVTKTSLAHVAAVGLTTRDTLLELTDTQYRFRSEDGHEALRVRKGTD